MIGLHKYESISDRPYSMNWILTKGDKTENIPGTASMWDYRSKGVQRK